MEAGSSNIVPNIHYFTDFWRGMTIQSPGGDFVVRGAPGDDIS